MDLVPTWVMLLGLGAFHGLNPGMGWLFAVALGLQHRSRVAVWRSLPPIAAGHALAIGVSVALVLCLQLTMSAFAVRAVVASILVAFASYRVIRRRHLRWAGMCVSSKDLVLWSFLMATAHGAGLMLAPILLGERVFCGAEYGVTAGQVFASNAFNGVMAAVIHTVGHLGAATLLAWIVYDVVGIRVLRYAWFNIDKIWIGILFVTAGIVCFA